MFINGKWKLSADGTTREIFNPANNRIIAGVDHIPMWLLRTDRATTELRWNFLFRRAGVYLASEDRGGEYFVGAVVS